MALGGGSDALGAAHALLTGRDSQGGGAGVPLSPHGARRRRAVAPPSLVLLEDVRCVSIVSPANGAVDRTEALLSLTRWLLVALVVARGGVYRSVA
jgi:hypothetical protein